MIFKYVLVLLQSDNDIAFKPLSNQHEFEHDAIEYV